MRARTQQGVVGRQRLGAPGLPLRWLAPQLSAWRFLRTRAAPSDHGSVNAAATGGLLTPSPHSVGRAVSRLSPEPAALLAARHRLAPPTRALRLVGRAPPLSCMPSVRAWACPTTPGCQASTKPGVGGRLSPTHQGKRAHGPNARTLACSVTCLFNARTWAGASVGSETAAPLTQHPGRSLHDQWHARKAHVACRRAPRFCHTSGASMHGRVVPWAPPIGPLLPWHRRTTLQASSRRRRAALLLSALAWTRECCATASTAAAGEK
jgi:hypothetical protein